MCKTSHVRIQLHIYVNHLCIYVKDYTYRHKAAYMRATVQIYEIGLEFWLGQMHKILVLLHCWTLVLSISRNSLYGLGLWTASSLRAFTICK